MSKIINLSLNLHKLSAKVTDVKGSIINDPRALSAKGENTLKDWADKH